MKDEFYQGHEYNQTEEFKRIPAEIYLVPCEENIAANEIAPLGNEITTTQPRVSKQKGDKQDLKSLADKLFHSIKGVATASTVAAAAIIGAATVATAPPEVELIDLRISDTYIEYEIAVDELTAQEDYFITISTSNEDDVEFKITENGTHRRRVEGLKPAWEYTLTLAGGDGYFGRTVYFERKFQTLATPLSPSMPQGPPVTPDLSITQVLLCGLNEVEIHFTGTALSETHTLSLLITHEGSDTAIPIPVTPGDRVKGYVRAKLETGGAFSVKPVLSNGTDTVELPAFTPTFDKTLDAETLVDLKNSSIIFYLKALVQGTAYVHVAHAETNEVLFTEKLYGNILQPYFDLTSDSVQQYVLYLTDEAGEKVSNDHTVTVDTTLSAERDYTLNYRNPSDVAITYNEDGTVNVYIKTDFKTTDAEVYYQVTLGDRVFRSRDKILEATDLPNQAMSLCYDVCFEKDGVQYSVYHVYPSGMVNEIEPTNPLQVTRSGTELLLQIEDYFKESVDLDTVRITTSSGEEFHITERDFTYNEDTLYYELTLSIGEGVTHVDLSVELTPNLTRLEGIEHYKGTARIPYTQTYY